MDGQVNYTRTADTLLTIKDVSLSFGPKLVLRDVNATITNVERPELQQGQVICFLGPSGIGKTQLSRIIAGLQQPTAGTVTLGNGKPAHKGGVGMVPQNYWLPEFSTVGNHLLHAGHQGGLTPKDSQDKANYFMESLGLRDYVGSYPAALSGGTRQRVAIARQLMCAEHYLVMDEPFSGLDPTTKRRCAKLIAGLANLDTLNTIIIVTHDVKQGLAVSDTVWLMGLEQKGSEHGTKEFVPGARIVETYDLAELDLAWHPNVTKDPKFVELENYIDERFDTLK